MALPPDDFDLAFLPLDEGRRENAGLDGYVIDSRYDWNVIKRDWDFWSGPLYFKEGGGLIAIRRRHKRDGRDPFDGVSEQQQIDYKIVNALSDSDGGEKWFGRRLVKEFAAGWKLAGPPTVLETTRFSRRILVPLRTSSPVPSQPQAETPYVPPQTMRPDTPRRSGLSAVRALRPGGGRHKTAKTIRMKKGEYLREHHHLFKVLRNPTRRALNAELRKQQKELRERGLKG